MSDYFDEARRRSAVGGEVRFFTSAENCPLQLGTRFQVSDGSKWHLVEVTEHHSTMRDTGYFSAYQTTVRYEVVPEKPKKPEPPATGPYYPEATWERIKRWFHGS